MVVSLFQVYWVGPVLGAVMAAALYDYLFCPNPELKKRYSEVFSKSGTKYREVQTSLIADHDQLVKEPPFTVMDVERAEQKERETSGEVLSSV